MESVAHPKKIQGDDSLPRLRRQKSPGARLALPALQEMWCKATPELHRN